MNVDRGAAMATHGSAFNEIAFLQVACVLHNWLDWHLGNIFESNNWIVLDFSFMIYKATNGVNFISGPQVMFLNKLPSNPKLFLKTDALASKHRRNIHQQYCKVVPLRMRKPFSLVVSIGRKPFSLSFTLRVHDPLSIMCLFLRRTDESFLHYREWDTDKETTSSDVFPALSRTLGRTEIENAL
jgi:hypothetical protein